MRIIETSKFKKKKEIRTDETVKIDLKEIRTLDESYKKQLKEAAFRAGMASKMIDKIASILTRKTGFKIGISSIAVPMKIEGRTYDTYFGYVNPNRAFRMNFLVGKSDLLESIDFYDSNTDDYPSTRVDLNGFNIVQVMDQIADYITGEFERYNESVKNKKNSLREDRLTLKDMATQWLSENPNYVSDIQSSKFNYEKMTGTFLDYIALTFNSRKGKMTAGALQWNIQAVLADNPSFGVNSKSVPAISVSVASSNEVVLPTKELQDLWNSVQNISPKQIMQTLEDDTRRIAQGDKLLPGLLVYGKPGTGKTQTIRRVLKEEGIKPIVIDEKLTAYSRVLWALYEYRTNQIIIIDDNDSIFDSEDNVNLLKKVLDMKPVRRVEINQPVKIFGTNNVVEESFDFDSKLIFISNKVQMDSAIKSRLSGVMHEINFTKEEMLELIKENLYNLYSDISTITDKMREDVYEFVEAIMPGVNDIDYRAFNFCLTYCHAANQAGAPDRVWKERSLRLLKDYGREAKRKKF
jgi:Cdc6-like AAA superfamily ATPase